MSRRTLLQGALAIAASRAVRAADAKKVLSADAFVESVGVNVHLGSEPYASRFEQFATLLHASGIRHLRDELRPSNDLKRWRQLYDTAGIRANLLVSPATNTVPEMLTYLHAVGAESVSAIEGQNEGDSDWFMSQPAAQGDWSKAVVAYQRDVYTALRQSYKREELPILSPSIIDWKPADVALIADCANYCDIVSIHSYVQHGQEPETQDDYAGLNWYLRNMVDPFKPGAPVMATETGYANVITLGGAGVSEAAAAIYIPRLLLNNFCNGVQRTFLYEFMNGGTNPAEGEENWGLVRSDGTPKPVYHAISNLLAALGSEARGKPNLVSRDFQFAVTRAPETLRTATFQKRDDEFAIAFWLAVPCWNPVSATDVEMPPEPVTILLNDKIQSATWSIPNDGPGSTEIEMRDNTLSLSVGAKPALLTLKLQKS